jgi:CRP-like cAMP-binding protein
MAKDFDQMGAAWRRHSFNSGIRPVPKLNRAPAAYPTLPGMLPELLKALGRTSPNEAPCQSVHARGSVLFTAGQPPTGIFMIEKGCVKLSMSSGRGRSLILGFFGPQSVLGLPATILGFPHESTAEATKPVTVRFFPRARLLQHMRAGATGLWAAQVVSCMFYSTLCEMEALWLTDSVNQKLSRFLLSFCSPRDGSRAPLQVPLDLTHEDIAQRIGVSRESVTRFFSRSRKSGILDLKESVLTILDPVRLERLADFPADPSSLVIPPIGSRHAVVSRNHAWQPENRG